MGVAIKGLEMVADISGVIAEGPVVGYTIRGNRDTTMLNLSSFHHVAVTFGVTALRQHGLCTNFVFRDIPYPHWVLRHTTGRSFG